jgi:hypothetical protein
MIDNGVSIIYREPRNFCLALMLLATSVKGCRLISSVLICARPLAL